MTSTGVPVVLHADDFGMNLAVTEGILRGFRDGLLTSTSLLSNSPHAVDALEQWKCLESERQARSLPSLTKRRRLADPDLSFDLGVHLNLTQGRPLTGERYPHELLDADGRFPGVLALFAGLRRGGKSFLAAVQTELERQVQFPCDHGLKPTHLNGHQYVELMPEISQIMPGLLAQFQIRSVRVACQPFLFRSTMIPRFQPWKWPLGWLKQRFAIPFRAQMDALGIAHPAVFFGVIHAGSVDMRRLQGFLEAGRRFSSVELGLHPAEMSRGLSAEEAADGWRDPLASRRPHELRLLVGDEIVNFMESKQLRLGRLRP